MTDRECLDFYRGVQWPAKVADQRRATKRSCLTVNVLRAVIDQAIVDTEWRENRRLTPAEQHNLICKMVREGADAQRMYNYQQSCMLEALELAPKAPWVMMAKPGPECEAITIEREIYKIGDTITVRRPPRFTGRDGA